jgi:hypothetical protein
MAEAAFWIAWGLPTQGREREALDLLQFTAALSFDSPPSRNSKCAGSSLIGRSS